MAISRGGVIVYYTQIYLKVYSLHLMFGIRSIMATINDK